MDLRTSFVPKTSIEPFYTGGDVSISNNILATTLHDRVVLTDLKNGQKLATIPGDTELITALQLSPDGTHLVTCSRSLQMHIYKLSTEVSGIKAIRVKSIKAHESPIMVVTIDPTSTLVATGGAEGAVKVWDLSGGYATHNFRGHGGIISALKFWGKQGTTEWKLASGSDDCKVRLWDLVKNKCVAVMDNHVSVIRGLDFSSNGKLLISGGRDKVVSIWNTKNGKLANTLPVNEVLETVGFIRGEDEEDEDNLTFYTGGEYGIVRIRSLTGKLLSSQEEPKVKLDEEVGVNDIIQYDSSLYAVMSDQLILQLSTENLSTLRRIAGNHGEVIDMCFLDEDYNKLAIATNSPEIRILSIDNPLECSILSGHTDIVITIDKSFDGKYLASAGKDNQARLWHNGKCHSVYSGHAGSIGAVALPRTPSDGLPEFIITGSQDLTVKRWNPRTKTADDNDKHITTAVYTRKAHDKDINAIDVSPNDRLFATASQDRTAKIWDIETGETIGILRGHKRGVWTVKFSQWDKTVATGSGDKTVRLWNLNDYTCIRTFEGHTNSVLKLSYLTHGKQIVSAGGDGLVKVWDVSSGECSSTLDNHEDKVWSVIVGSKTKPDGEEDDDGGIILSGGGDSIITVWEDMSEEERIRKQDEAAELVEKEQELFNYINKQDWSKAFALALSLDHPFRLLKLLQEVYGKQEPNSITGLLEVDSIIETIDDDSLVRLLQRVRDWNTNARTSVIAQVVLHAILKHHSAEKLSNIQGISNIIDSLIPYSERHYTRVDDLLAESSVLEYALREMTILRG